MKPLLDVDTSDEWDQVIAVNLSGAFYCTQAAARAMVEGGKGGRIINIASQAAKTGFPHLPAYVSSKHGMVGLTRASAVELGKHGITVNAVCPNHVTTGLGAQQNEYFSKLLGFATVEDYLAAKIRLFTEVLPAGGIAVLDPLEPYADRVLATCQARGLRLMTVGVKVLIWAPSICFYPAHRLPSRRCSVQSSFRQVSSRYPSS
jgi:NAD(P)-dependent dehydrogenase (short-subunit alcohol dehydrogenase family)